MQQGQGLVSLPKTQKWSRYMKVLRLHSLKAVYMPQDKDKPSSMPEHFSGIVTQSPTNVIR